MFQGFSAGGRAMPDLRSGLWIGSGQAQLGELTLELNGHAGFLVFLDLRFWNETPVANLRTRASRCTAMQGIPGMPGMR